MHVQSSLLLTEDFQSLQHVRKNAKQEMRSLRHLHLFTKATIDSVALKRQ